MQLLPSLKPDGARPLGLRRFSLRNALVVLQVGVSLPLVIGAVLMLRSVGNAQSVDPGFETEQVVMVSTDLGLHGYDESRGQRFFEEAAERVASLPEIESASLADKLPLGVGVGTRTIAPEGQQIERSEDWPEIDVSTIGPGYFEVMGIPLLQGRDFAARDTAEGPPVVIVNESTARRFWPGESPVGKRVATERGDRLWEVIAVVRDAKVRTIGEDPRPQVYFALTQDYSPMMYVVARTLTSPELGLEAAQREILEMDSRLAFFEAKTMQQNMAITLFPVRMGAALFGVFGALALVLAAVGLYGVVAYSVSRRTKEIGIRMALGASPRNVLALVSRQGLWLVLIGLAVGLVGAVAGTRVLSTVLYGVDATDVTSYAGTALMLLAVALIANWMPARRAARVNPVTSLREQ